MLCTRQQNVDTVGGLEETTFLLRVASNQGDDNDLGFFTLEVIDCRHSDGLEQSCFSKGASVWCFGIGSLFLNGLKIICVAIVDTNLEHGFHPAT
ncbi:hypothetical protein HG531_007070 [Fusarium graminearum]|nr:hypothetical protein HG531_007070 [Fusarium graminearum]